MKLSPLALLLLLTFPLWGTEPTVVTNFVPAPSGASPLGVVQSKDGNFYGTCTDGVFKMTPSGTLSRLATFTGSNGLYPQTNLIAGSDGNLYGTTSQSSSLTPEGGSIYKVTPDGVVTTLYVFPYGYAANGLIQGQDGALYGTTSTSFFKLGTDGVPSTLANVGGITGNIIQAKDGNFYGTTVSSVFSGNTDENVFTVFRITPAGVTSTLTSFTAVNSGGIEPAWSIIQGKDGDFYGLTNFSGISKMGALIKIGTNGAVKTLYSFTSSNPYPDVALTEGGDGSFYGTGGFTGTLGVVFKITSTGNYVNVASFDGTNGATPYSGLIVAQDGNFYGTMKGKEVDQGAIYQMTPGGVVTPLCDFVVNGVIPTWMIQASDGNFYGTTELGGSGFNGPGTLFKVDPSGTLTTLHAFQGTDGGSPNCLIESRDGQFYGTTGLAQFVQNGTFFKMDSAGNMTTLATFPYQTAATGIIEGLDGNFYGTSTGANIDGTIFKITPQGVLTTLITFSGVNGKYPLSQQLVQDSKGTLYGTTSYGGTYGLGTVFSLTSAGVFKTLVSFDGTNGARAGEGLTIGKDGNIYGLTCGTADPFEGSGSAFRITPTGVFTYLTSLANWPSPSSRLLAAPDGNFYYTSNEGGQYGYGAVIQLTSAGILTTVASFNQTDGSSPSSQLLEGSNGLIYGTAQEGGTANSGVVFSLPLPPRGNISQTISFPPIGNQVYGVQPILLNATATSALSVTYKVTGPASLNGNILTFTGAGAVTVAGYQPGNAFYKAAPEVRQTFVVNKGNQAITAFTPIPLQTFGLPVTITPPTTNSGLKVTVTVKSGPATLSKNTLILTGVGTVTLAANQAGSTKYNPALEVTTSFIVKKGSQIITFPPVGNQAVGVLPIVLQAISSSGLPVTYKATGPATVSGNALTVTGVGNVTVGAYQSGSPSYSPAPEVRQSFKVSAAP